MKRVNKTKKSENIKSQNGMNQKKEHTIYRYDSSRFITSVADKGISNYVINKPNEMDNYPSGTIATGTSTDFGLSLGQNQFSINSEKEYIDIIKNVRQFLETYPKNIQFEQANEIINTINDLLMGYQNLNLPNFFISSAPDGTLGISWQIADALLGISIDRDPKESSWFLLIGENDDAFRAYGRLSKLNKEILLDSLVNLLRKIQKKQDFSNE
jgi:hypothetical protein